jgi:hypothetical protein
MPLLSILNHYLTFNDLSFRAHVFDGTLGGTYLHSWCNKYHMVTKSITFRG